MSEAIRFKISKATYGIDSLHVAGDSLGAEICLGDYFTAVARAETGKEEPGIIQVASRSTSGYYLKSVDVIVVHDGDELRGRVTRPTSK